MAYIKTIAKGTLGAGEVWSCAISWGIFGTGGQGANQQLVDAILANLLSGAPTTALPLPFKQLLSTNGALTGWRVEQRGEDERILALSEGLAVAPVVGQGAPTKSPQDACVISLRSSTPGPTGRGRFYWPALGADLTLQYVMDVPTPASAVAGARTWLNAIGTAVNAAFGSLSIPSTVVLSVRSVKNHVCRDVTSLQVGSVLDTQRRRRDSLPEAYSSVAYP